MATGYIWIMEDLRIEDLTQDEKLQLIEQIWTSIDKESGSLTRVQEKELERRLVKYEAGGELRTWEEVQERIRKNR